MKWKELGILGLWIKNYLWNSRWWHWTVIHTDRVSVMCLHHVSSPAPSPASCHSEPGAKLTCWGLLNCSVPPKEALWMDTSWSTLGRQALSFSLIYSWKGDVQLWRVGDFFSGRDRGWGPEVYVAYSSSSSISCSVVSDSHDLMDCSPPGCSVYGILQSRILEWVTIHFSRGSSPPRDRTWVSCAAGKCFTVWVTREAHWNGYVAFSFLNLKEWICVIQIKQDVSFPLWRGQWHPPPVPLPGKSHGQRSLVGHSLWGCWAGHDWAISLSLFTFMHWRRKWQPTPVFLPGESQGRGSLVGCRLWGRTESDTTEVTAAAAAAAGFPLNWT